jgi:hypothetical protein
MDAACQAPADGQADGQSVRFPFEDGENRRLADGHSHPEDPEDLLCRLGRFPDPRDDLVGFVFGDRDELVLGVAALGGVQ